MAALQREFAGKGLRFSRGEWRQLPWPHLFIVFPIKCWEREQESWLLLWGPGDPGKSTRNFCSWRTAMGVSPWHSQQGDSRETGL